MTTQVVASTSKLSDFTFKLVKKLQSVPAIAVFAFVGLLLGMCIYYSPLETYAPITNWYHTHVPNDYWRHLLFRAYPETMFAAWFAQCVAVLAVVNGKLKQYRVFKTHELFWRPVVGLLATIPGAAAMAGALFLWNKYGIGSRVHSAAQAFCKAGSSGHCLSQHAIAVINAHPGVLGQFEQSVLLDGQKKLIVLAGSFIFGVFLMKQYFLNVQGWLAEHHVIDIAAKNEDRRSRGKKLISPVRLYHHLIPGYKLRIIEAVLAGESSLHRENHRSVNNNIYKAFKAVVVAGVFGGLYILFFIAQGTQLHLSVIH
jgi:hypothetical protein